MTSPLATAEQWRHPTECREANRKAAAGARGKRRLGCSCRTEKAFQRQTPGDLKTNRTQEGRGRNQGQVDNSSQSGPQRSNKLGTCGGAALTEAKFCGVWSMCATSQWSKEGPGRDRVGAGDFSINTFNVHHRQRGDGQGSNRIDLSIIVLNKKTYRIVGSSVVLFNILGENPASLRPACWALTAGQR